MDQFHPEFRSFASLILRAVSVLCEPLGFTCYIASGYRDFDRQLELYKKGREMVNGKWRIVHPDMVVTHALPGRSAHTVTLKGKPASCAMDVAIVQDHKWLPDKHPAWGLIGTAVSFVDSDKLVWGAHFSRLRDWAHVELKDWERYQDG